MQVQTTSPERKFPNEYTIQIDQHLKKLLPKYKGVPIVSDVFAICSRPSVCLSVTLVHPTQAVVIFSNISTAFGTLAIR